MPNDKCYYSILDEEDFVRALGCWKYAAPIEQVMELRTGQEYRGLLEKYLEVNSQRTDRLGIHGCLVAKRELKGLGK